MDYRSPHRSHLVLSPGLPATGPSPLHQTHNCVTSLLKHREQLPTALLTPAIGTLRERTRGTRTVQAFPSLFLAITVILEESYYSVIIITPNIIPTLHLVTSVLSASFPEPPTNWTSHCFGFNPLVLPLWFLFVAFPLTEMVSYLPGTPPSKGIQTHLLHMDFSYLLAKNNVGSSLSEIFLYHLYGTSIRLCAALFPLLDCTFFKRLSIMTSTPVLSTGCTKHICSRSVLRKHINFENKT